MFVASILIHDLLSGTLALLAVVGSMLDWGIERTLHKHNGPVKVWSLRTLLDRMGATGLPQDLPDGVFLIKIESRVWHIYSGEVKRPFFFLMSFVLSVLNMQ